MKVQNQRVLHFEFQCQNLLRLYHNTYISLFYIDLFSKWSLWFMSSRYFKICPQKFIPIFRSHQEALTSKLIILKIKWDTECEFMSCLTIWRHPHSNTSITFGIGGRNAMKKQCYENVILRYLSLKFSWNQIIKAIGLILRHNMFGVPIKFFYSVAYK